jgi:2',3'-cyclic-nucleotide 2'-phosphodiesterase (5'-nucleotidase family)
MATKARRRSPPKGKKQSSPSKSAERSRSTKLTVRGFEFHVFVQINDVYFLDARPNYARPEGLILPRIATMVRRLRRHLPNQITFCVPGDFLAPSCLGKLSTGEHMVDIFNSLGVDFVTFGNHEFEQPPLSAATLARNITQSNFRWLCANFSPSAPELIAIVAQDDKLRPYRTFHLRDDLVVVLLGVTLKDRYRGYGEATDSIAATQDVIRRAYEEIPILKDRAAQPIFIALTHQDAADDVRLARACPDLLMIMGGHDHDEEYVIDQMRPLIVKATSNARLVRFNVLLHRRREMNEAPLTPEDLEDLWLDVRSRVLNRVFNTLTHRAAAAAPREVRNLIGPPVGPVLPNLQSHEIFIDDTRLRSGIVPIGDYDVGVFSFAMGTAAQAFANALPEYGHARSRIDYWEQKWDRANVGTRQPIIVLPLPFDARDAHVRKRSTNLGNLAADAVRLDVGGRELAAIGLLNSGSLRADRVFERGEPISQRTICDLLFFDNKVFVYALSGRELWGIFKKSLELSTQGGAEGHGDFLQISGVKAYFDGSNVARVIQTQADNTERDLPDDDTVYDVATTDYVAQISRHYKSFFERKLGREVDLYNRQFDAAVRRLRPIRTREDALGYYVIHNSRWLPADRIT